MNHVARYMGGGRIEISHEPMPTCPEGGLLIRTEACGLCSGELMDWYMDQKVPHVLGHEVAGIVVESEDGRFPVGSRVFPHHHAPCMNCELCQTGRFVHCPTWKRTKLVPGGMGDFFGVPAENLSDTHLVSGLRAIDAALIEPLACVVKSINLAGEGPYAVVGLGVMGLLHALLLPDCVGYDLAEPRRAWARSIGIDAQELTSAKPVRTVFVCPGSQAAFDFALSIIEPGGTIVMFAPLAPGASLQVPQTTYFRDITIRHAYSCGPLDTAQAISHLDAGTVRAEQVVSEFVRLDELPTAYGKMKRAEILKPMVVFDTIPSS